MKRRKFLMTSVLSGTGMAVNALNHSAYRSVKIPESSLELKRTIPLNKDYDIIIIGGGPSGSAAAIAAGREGSKVLLIEAMGCLGGMGTSGLVPSWTPFSDGVQFVYQGIAEKVFNESLKGVPHVPKDKTDWVPINPEWLKLVYDRMVKGSGTEILFFSRLASINLKGNGDVDAIIVSNKSGLTAYQAKVYVDCTGDGDLAAWAGASCKKGNATGMTMQATHCFNIANINPFNLELFNSLHGANPKSPAREIVNSGKYPLIKDTHLVINLIGPNTAGLNAGHLSDVDGTDPVCISRAMLNGREISFQYLEALKEFRPEIFAGSFRVNTAQLLGVRESRIVEGDYILSFKDYIARASFSDEIGRNNYYIDIHSSKEMLESIYGINVFNTDDPEPFKYENGESHGIPYRCLTPKGIKNVLVAGRCISTEEIVQGSTRIQAACLVTGEAAGMAAVHACRNHKNDVHEVDVDFLRKRLKEEGQYIR